MKRLSRAALMPFAVLVTWVSLACFAPIALAAETTPSSAAIDAAKGSSPAVEVVKGSSSAVAAVSAGSSEMAVGKGSTPAAPADAPPALRLPPGARPIRYAVELTLSPGEESFSGIVDIEIEVDRPLPLLWLNASSLTVSEASLAIADDAAPEGGAPSIHAPQHPRIVPGGEDFVGFAFDPPVGPGRATLHVVYTGEAGAKESRGIFRRKEGADWYLFTQFEELGARHAFPCFDEPGFKVPWRLTLSVPDDVVAVSNAPLAAETSEKKGRRTFRFDETRPLPSYLVAFAVGPFEFAEGPPAGAKGVPFRIVTPKGQRSQAAYAVASTPEILSLIEVYFGSSYPYDKLDIIAVPLFGGAMENPGLITFSRNLLLAKPEEETIGRQRRFTTVAAHELAHMWFGDLVTLAWWNDIWLNESFANWMEYKIVEQWKPGWGMPLSRTRRRNFAMGTDSLISARRMRQPIESNDDIANAFDAITYDKGASVLAMFEGWIGADTFRKGVQSYLTQHAWGSTVAEDLFESLSREAGRDVSAAFNSFLDQGGVPLVTETLSCPAGSPPSIHFAQKRFLPVGSRGSAKQTWKIPICIRYGIEGGAAPSSSPSSSSPSSSSSSSGEHRRCLLLDEESSDVSLEGPCPTWLVPNEGMAGYYRAHIVIEEPGGRGLPPSKQTEDGAGVDRSPARFSGSERSSRSPGGNGSNGIGAERGRDAKGGSKGPGENRSDDGETKRFLTKPNTSSPFLYTARLFEGGGAASRGVRPPVAHLTANERVGLLDDLSALVESGDVSAGDLLSLLPVVVQDGSRASYEAAIGMTKDLRPHRVPAPLLPNYRRFVQAVFGSKARELGFRARRGEPEDARLLRPSLVSLVAMNGEDARLQKRARSLASKWLRDHRVLEEDMVDVVLAAASRRGDEALFDRFHAAARKSTDRAERRHLLDAMAEFQDPHLVQKRLPLMLSEEFDVRDAMTLLRGTLDEPRTREIVLEFVEKNYSALADRLPKSGEARLAAIGSAFCDAAHRAEVESFFKDRTTRATGGPRILAEILEEIDLCVARTQAQQPSLNAFLERY